MAISSLAMARMIFDGVVIDRVFQPVADWLESREINLFTVAKFFLDGAMFLFAGNFLSWVIFEDRIDLVMIGLVSILIFACVLLGFINRVLMGIGERLAKPGMLNPNRYILSNLRLTCLLFCVCDNAESMISPTLYHFLIGMGWLSWVLGVYLGSCNRHPKIRQTNKVPAAFLAQTL